MWVRSGQGAGGGVVQDDCDHRRLQRRRMGRHRLEQIDAVLRPLGGEGPAKEATEAKADAVEAAGEEKANAMDDNGEIAPSETGVGDTQKK